MTPYMHEVIEKAYKSGHCMKLEGDNKLLISNFDTLDDAQRFWLKLHKREIIDALYHLTKKRFLLKHCDFAIASDDDFYALRNIAAFHGWKTYQEFKQQQVGIYQNPLLEPLDNGQLSQLINRRN
jgi:hypothetical protein